MLISQKIQKEHALSEVTNFIAQEIYRLAVMEHYPEDYSEIKDLSRNIWDKFLSLREHLTDDLINDLSSEIINNIVFQIDEDTFENKIKELIANYDYLENELEENILKIAKEIFLEYSNLNCNIQHKYPPHILSFTFDYKDALEHYYGLYFLQQKQGNTILTTSPPYFSIRPYSTRSISRIKVITEEIEIPNQALSKNLDTVIELDTNKQDLLESYIDLNIYRSSNNDNSATYISKLRCELDTSSPLSDKEIDKFFSHLRAEIASIQNKNRQCRLLTAENQQELIDAYQIPQIKCDNWEKIEKLHKIELPDLSTSSHAKNYLLGLILAHEHYINKKNRNLNGKGDGLKISDRADFLSQELAQHHGEKGFTSGMIKKGYKLVRNAINKNINDFKLTPI